jgi:predicted Rossmann fold nucleotide-binding protein DprA/Smf involved in DNA uptake
MVWPTEKPEDNLMAREGVITLSSTQFVLLLHSVPYLGEKTLTRLLRTNARLRVTPEEFLLLSPAEWLARYELDPRAADYLARHQTDLLVLSGDLARAVRAHDVQVLTCESMTYPHPLDRYDDAPPPILYALGNRDLLDIGELHAHGRFTFTVAVSNGAPTESLVRLDQIAAALVEAGGIPVTGHDRAPYKRLALAAQRMNRPIIYVLDRGLREALGPEFDRPPFAAARIREAVFDAGRDLALSPFRLDDHSIGANNRRRDRIIFALSDLVIAVDVNSGGAMETECRQAHTQGRLVWVAAGGREGNAELLAAGCPPLPEDIRTGLRFSN